MERVLHTCHFLPSTAEAWQKKSGGDDYEKRAGIPKTDGADEHLNLAVWPVQFIVFTMSSKLSPSKSVKRDAFTMLYGARENRILSSSKADGLVDENQNPFPSTNNCSATTEPSQSKVGRTDIKEGIPVVSFEWIKEGEFESLLTATNASSYQWVRNKTVGSNSKRAGGLKVIIKGCNSCQGCPARVCFLRIFLLLYSISFSLFCILFWLR